MCGLSTLEQTEAARRSGRSRHRSNSSNDLLIRGDILRYRARSFQPKFRPVRPGKVVHVKRWTSFFETFLVGPHRSIEFWTEITGNWGWMVAPIFIVLSQISMFVYGHNVFIISGRWIFEKGAAETTATKVKPQYFTRNCDNLSKKCFLLFRLTYRDARPRDDRNRKYFMEFAPFTRFLHWFTISYPIFLQKPNWSSFFINKKLQCVNAEWRSCNVWILSEKNKVPYSTSAFPLHAYVSWHVPSIRLVVIYVWYLCVNCCMSYDLLLGIHSMEFTNYMIKWFAL